MDPTATPRRALAPLDANKLSPAPSKLKSGPSPAKSPVKALWQTATGSKKRPSDAPEQVTVKRACVEVATKSRPAEPKTVGEEERRVKGREEQIDRDQSASPDASSVFDNSAFETHDTTVTEPDLAVVRRPSRATRDQTRKMADNLKARLRLANYKLKTGQTHVPFTQLEATSVVTRQRLQRPLPTVQVHRPSSSSQPEEEHDKGTTMEGDKRAGNKDEGQKLQDEEAGVEEGPALPPLSARQQLLTPRKMASTDEQKLTSSGLRGGAANGLLRLSQGS